MCCFAGSSGAVGPNGRGYALFVGLGGMTKIERLWHTVRHLQPQQIIFRIYYKLFRGFVSRRALGTLLQWRRRAWKKPWSAPLVGGQSLVSEGRFQFLGELGVVRTAGDWNQVDKSKLWLYNLHYLDDLNAAGADERYDELQSLINQWNKENLPMVGNGWGHILSLFV